MYLKKRLFAGLLELALAVHAVFRLRGAEGRAL